MKSEQNRDSNTGKHWENITKYNIIKKNHKPMFRNLNEHTWRQTEYLLKEHNNQKTSYPIIYKAALSYKPCLMFPPVHTI